MNIKKYIFFKLIALFCISELAYGQLPFEKQFRFKHFSTQNGLVNNKVMSINQDQYGFIWIATYDGLNRFDGVEMVSYQHKINDTTSLSSGRVRKVYVDSKNNVWAISGSRGISLYNRELDNFIRFQHDPNDDRSISRNQIRDIYEDKEGRLWVGTDKGGLNLLIDGGFQKIPFNGNYNYDVYSIMQDLDGKLLLDLNINNTLFKFDPSTQIFEKIEFDKSVNERPPYYGLSFVQLGGLLWVGEPGGGLYGIENNQTKHHFDFGTITDLITYSPNELLIALENDGLLIYNIETQKFTEITNNKGDIYSLSSNQINCIFYDKQKNIWIGTHGGGLNKLENFKIEAVYANPFSENSISDNRILSLLEDSKKNLWVGTDGGGLNLIEKNGKITNYSKDDNKNSVSGNIIMGLMEDKEGKIWITTYGNGISILNPTTNKFDYVDYDATFWKIIQDNDGLVWAGLTRDVLVNIDTDSYITHPIMLDSTLITDRFIPYLLIDNKGDFWVSIIEDGLYKLENNRLKKVDLGILNSFTILSMHQDSLSNLWLGTEGMGLVRLNIDNLNHEIIFKNSDILESSVMSIEEDSNSNLWLGTNHGLVKYNTKTSTIRQFNINDGLLSETFTNSASLKTHNGYMIYGSTEGLNYFHPDSIDNNLFAPPVVFTSFKVFEKEVPIDENGPLKSNILTAKTINLHFIQSSITIAFAALNHNQTENNKYSYFMEGVDREWSIPSNQTNKNYTSLQPGKYSFRVKAQNNDGIWSQERILTINVSTPWWATTIVKFAYLLLFLVLTTLIFLYRTKSIRQQKETLSRLVEEKTKGLLAANDDLVIKNLEIEAQSEQIKKTFSELQNAQSQLIQSEKMASIGQLTAGIAHEINNPINFITAGTTALALDMEDLMKYVGHAEKIKDDKLQKIKDEIDFDFVTKNIQQTIKDIRQGGDRTAEIVKELRTFSRLDDSSFKKSDIHKGLDSTLVLLQSKFKNNNITLVKNYFLTIKIECNLGQLNQVFMNVLTNAIQAIKEKGTIIITTRDDGENVSISIKDSGPGIPLKIRKKIFDPFFTTKDVGEGTGLGLSISYGIIEKHHGKIDLICEDGCEFIIKLPKNQHGLADK